MAWIIFLLTSFTFLAVITAAPSNSERAGLEKFTTKLNKNYKDHGLDGIYKDLKSAWAQVVKAGQKQSPRELSNLEEVLKQVGEDYSKKAMNGIHNDPEEEWEKYIKVFGKEYPPEEREVRKTIFKKNKERVEKHNEMFKQGKVSYSIELNHLSDRTWEEVQQRKSFPLPNSTGHSIPHARQKRKTQKFRHFVYDSRKKLPASLDWAKNGFVTPVKEQGYCGGCYAFVGIGALEAYHKRKTGDLIRLSEQNILDCTWNIGNEGCNGGAAYKVFDYAHCRGVLSAHKYPYTYNSSRYCKWKKEHVAATDNGFLVVPGGNELSLQHAVVSFGPVAADIAIAADFHAYKQGVYNLKEYNDINHSVLIVGYGTHPSWGDYWICKNSFGKLWGDNGYVLIPRNKNNAIGVASFAVFPI